MDRYTVVFYQDLPAQEKKLRYGYYLFDTESKTLTSKDYSEEGVEALEEAAALLNKQDKEIKTLKKEAEYLKNCARSDSWANPKFNGG